MLLETTGSDMTGAFARMLRYLHGETLRSMAEKIGVAPHTVWRFENGCSVLKPANHSLYFSALGYDPDRVVVVLHEGGTPKTALEAVSRALKLFKDRAEANS